MARIDCVTCVQIFIFHNESGFYQRLGANASDTSVVIDNIAKHITYRARILAHNRIGDGVLSDVVFVGKTRTFSCFVELLYVADVLLCSCYSLEVSTSLLCLVCSYSIIVHMYFVKLFKRIYVCMYYCIYDTCNVYSLQL